jgi:hypothetical protein
MGQRVLEGRDRVCLAILDADCRSDPKEVVGTPISNVLVGDQYVFSKATDIILSDDAHSLRVRFVVAMGDASKFDEQDEQGVFKLDDKLPEALEMEGQGILVRDDASANATHVYSTSIQLILDHVGVSAVHRTPPTPSRRFR